MLSIHVVPSDIRELIADTLAKWRIRFFREYPYLYEGKMADEVQYTAIYHTADDANFCLAEKDDEIVGIISGVPLENPYFNEMETLFNQVGMDTSSFYYIGEVIVLPECRGQGIAKKLLDEQERFAVEKGYKYCCLMTVERPMDHVFWPNDYFNTDEIWGRAGYHKTDMKMEVEYPTIQQSGTVDIQSNTMVFWLKSLMI